jgi:hypothetical protein
VSACCGSPDGGAATVGTTRIPEQTTADAIPYLHALMA